MRVFLCSRCDQLLFFENVSCVRCGSRVGFLPDRMRLDQVPSDYRPCRNEQVCNWMLPPDDAQDLCRSCRLTRTIPSNHARWAKLEAAKRRLVYTLLELKLPMDGLTFDFLDPEAQSEPVTTGHADGVITINAAEADDPTREEARVNLNEFYRTLLGHLRHETGHFYWDRLIRPHPEKFRERFGDERQDYAEALRRHHSQGPPPDWLERGFISAYASCHPWEDWAETWAHYLHIVDTLETAHSFGLDVKGLQAEPERQLRGGFELVLKDWIPLTLALNSLNRSMGLNDPYPFVLSEGAIRKLEFVHVLILGE